MQRARKIKREMRIRNKSKMRERKRISAASTVSHVVKQGIVRMHAQQDKTSQKTKTGIATLHGMLVLLLLTKF